MKHSVLVILAVLATTAIASEPGPAPPWKEFGFGHRTSDQGLKMKIPEIALSESERESLVAGKPVTRMVDSPKGYKIAYLRFFAPFDPVTAWMVVTDVDHYDLTDPVFDATGCLTEKRRSFWPHAFENNTCLEDGEYRMSQLIVTPLLAPRKLCLVGTFSTEAFPWESYWDLASDAHCCESRREPEMSRYFDRAVAVTRSKEAWHISPLPEALRKTPADAMRADCIYMADVNPGGELGRFDALTERVGTTSLPQLMKHVIARGNRWESFLTARYGPEEICRYREWVELYRKSASKESVGGFTDGGMKSTKP